MTESDPLSDLPTIGGAQRLRPDAAIGPSGRYLLEEEAGRGGMGVVWKARDEVVGDRVALKFLPEALAFDEISLDGLKHEARTLLGLTHPGVVRLRNLELDQGLLFLVMEYLAGPTLRGVLAARLRAGKRGLGTREARWILEQIAPALDFAHQRKILHRDLKPANLMLTAAPGDPLGVAGEEVKLTDFGIAYVATTSFTQLTGRQDTSGTLPYMAPELLRGRPPSVASDLYALGATLYELVAGGLPFVRGDISLQIREEEAPALESGDAALDAAVEAALAKEPTDRPASAAAFVEQARRQVVVTAPAPTRVPQSVRPVEPPAQTDQAPAPAPARKPVPAGHRFRRLVFLVLALTGLAIVSWPDVIGWGRGAVPMEEETESTPPQPVAQLDGLPASLRASFQTKPGAPMEPDGKGGQVPKAILHQKTGLEFLWVPSGEFELGSPEGEDGHQSDESPTRQVRMSGFYLAKTETTWQAWKAGGGQGGEGAGDSYPVTNVDWNAARAWCERNGLMLPSEAQWEYAASGPDNRVYPWGADWDRSRCNADGTGGQDRWERTSPVGAFTNPSGASWCGMEDMAGNVYEWCQDRYGEYQTGPVADPKGPSSGDRVVLRGGSWNSGPGYCRSANRSGRHPDFQSYSVGFRAARTF